MTHEMCAEAKDPKACEQRVSQMRDKAKDVRTACQGKQGAERTDCVVKERCTGAKDAAKCEAETRSGMARREKIREACKDRHGDDLRACIREQRG
jgi:hypothetical protein